jgi:hypothetical protein
MEQIDCVAESTLESGARALDQRVVGAAGAAQVKKAGGEIAIAQSRRHTVIILQYCRTELVVVRVRALQINETLGGIGE